MAYGVKSHKFLFCLPVRLGVFVLSFLHILLYGIAAAAFWASLGFKDNHYDRRDKVSVILTAISCTTHTIYALVGFIGAISRRLSLIKGYTEYLVYLFCLALIFGVYYIITIFTRDKDELIKSCIDGRTDQKTIDACQHVTMGRFVLLGLIIASWLVTLYECIIFDRYVKQLEEEKQEKHRLKSLTTPMYDPVGGRASTERFPVQFRDDEGAGAPSGSMNARGEVKLYAPGRHGEV